MTEMEIPATLRSGHECLHPRLLSPPCLFGCCPIAAGLVTKCHLPDVVTEVTKTAQDAYYVSNLLGF